MRHDQRRRRENKVTRCVITMGLGIDEITDGERRKLLHRGEQRARIGGVMAAVDEDDAFLGEDNAGVRVQVIADVNVDAVFDLTDVGTEILGREGPAVSKLTESTSARASFVRMAASRD